MPHLHIDIFFLEALGFLGDFDGAAVLPLLEGASFNLDGDGDGGAVDVLLLLEGTFFTVFSDSLTFIAPDRFGVFGGATNVFPLLDDIFFTRV